MDAGLEPDATPPTSTDGAVEAVDAEDARPNADAAVADAAIAPDSESPSVGEAGAEAAVDAPVDAGSHWDAAPDAAPEPDAEVDAATDASVQADASTEPDGSVEMEAGVDQDAGWTVGCGAFAEGELDCTGPATRERVRCEMGAWVATTRCASDERCDSREGAGHGDCLPLIDGCQSATPGDLVCDPFSTGRLVCGADLVTSESRACGSGAHCESAGGLARCVCDDGYAREPSSGDCAPIDDCIGVDCGVGGRCVDGDRSYTCACDPGYESGGASECSEIDECVGVSCGEHEACVDEVDGYRCDCDTGYGREGGSECVRVRCAMQPCEHWGRCTDASPSFICDCLGGWQGARCEELQPYLGGRALWSVSDDGSHLVMGPVEDEGPIEIDLATGYRAAMSTDPLPDRASVLARVGSRVMLGSNGGLHAVDLDSGGVVLISGTQRGQGPAFAARPRAAVSNAFQSRLYVAAGAALYAVEISSGDRTLVSGDGAGSGTAIGALDAMGMYQGYVYARDAEREVLVRIHPDSGARTDVADLTLPSRTYYGDRMVIDPARGLALYSTSGGLTGRLGTLMSVDLVSGSVQVFSDLAFGDAPVSGAGHIVLDSAHDRVIVERGPALGLVSVDLSTGEREIVVSEGRGQGPVPYGMRGGHLDGDGGRVLVADRGVVETIGVFDAGRLLSVDLETGDRTVVSDASDAGPSFEFPNDVTSNPDVSRLWVFDSGLGAVIEVDPRDGSRVLRSAEGSPGSGPSFDYTQELVFDAAADRILLAVSNPSYVLSLDVNDGDRSTLSSTALPNSPTLYGIDDIALDAANGRALVSNSSQPGDQGVNRGLVGVSLATGARSMLSGQQHDAAFWNPHRVAMGPDGIAYVTDRSAEVIHEVDLTTGQRRTVSSDTVGRGPSFGSEVRELFYDAARNRLVLVVGSMLAVDPETGDRAVISR